MSPAEIRERYERIREEVGPDVTVVAATKYVSLDDLAALAEAGIEVVGENRAQDLQAKHERIAPRFGAELARNHLASNAEQPQPWLGRDAVEPSPGDEEGFGGDILGAFGVDPRESKAQHGPEVLPVQLLEPLPVIRHR